LDGLLLFGGAFDLVDKVVPARAEPTAQVARVDGKQPTLQGTCMVERAVGVTLELRTPKHDRATVAAAPALAAAEFEYFLDIAFSEVSQVESSDLTVSFFQEFDRGQDSAPFSDPRY
jgi:hypothetical protein